MSEAFLFVVAVVVGATVVAGALRARARHLAHETSLAKVPFEEMSREDQVICMEVARARSTVARDQAKGFGGYRDGPGRMGGNF